MIIRNAAQLICIAARRERVKCAGALRDLMIIPDGAVVISDDRIHWVGRTSDLPPIPPDTEIIDASGKVVLPGFIDSHTHLVFAGSREDEFQQRLAGATYQEIAARGGGIEATVRRVRETSRDDLKRLARPRLERLLRFGVTTVEVKSGYGLS